MYVQEHPLPQPQMLLSGRKKRARGLLVPNVKVGGLGIVRVGGLVIVKDLKEVSLGVLVLVLPRKG